MKLIFVALFFFLSPSFLFAQEPDSVLAKVKYQFTWINDTTRTDSPHIENMILIIGKNASQYTSYDKIIQDEIAQKSIEQQIKNNGGLNNIHLTLPNRKSITQDEYFYFAKENKFFLKERVINFYLIEEPPYTIDWKISNDTMSFSGIHCQKATAHFKGRNWNAWFATELPFQSGPWKLHGLPGLIIDAYDDTKTVRFEFAGLDNIKDEVSVAEKKDMDPGSVKIVIPGSNVLQEKEIKLPSDAIRTTQKEFDKLKEAFKKDPDGFLSAQLGGDIKVKTTKVQGPTKTTKRSVTNNPIELKE